MNLHDKAPLQKQSTTKSCKLFSQKISTTSLEWAQNRPSEWEIVLLAKIQELKTIQNSKTQMMQITYNICKVKTPTIMSLQKLLVNWEKCLKIKSIEYSVLKVLKTILKVLKPVPKSPPAQIIQMEINWLEASHTSPRPQKSSEQNNSIDDICDYTMKIKQLLNSVIYAVKNNLMLWKITTKWTNQWKMSLVKSCLQNHNIKISNIYI